MPGRVSVGCDDLGCGHAKKKKSVEKKCVSRTGSRVIHGKNAKFLPISYRPKSKKATITESHNSLLFYGLCHAAIGRRVTESLQT